MFYLPMENEMAQNILNQQPIVYIRLLYNMLAFELGPKTYYSTSLTPIGKMHFGITPR